MAVYKIPQDVEADDKFVGPLSFKQFIYCGIAGISVYLSFLSLTKGFWPALVFFLPVITATGFLGFPWGRDQPTEIWLAARIRFFIKPRMRIWNQSGIKDLVTVTAPKHIERHFTNGLSQNEVSSRLTGLADLLDSRGWAVKNVNVNMYSNPVASESVLESDDRLLNVAALPQEVVDVTTADDVLDETTSPTAQHFEAMIKDSEQKHRQEVLDQLQAARASEVPQDDATQPAPPKPKAPQGKADFWFLQQGGDAGRHQAAKQVLEAVDKQRAVDPEAGFTTFNAPAVVAPHSAAPVLTASETTSAAQTVSAQDEQALLEKIHKDHDGSHNPYSHIKTIMPISETPVAAAPAVPAPPAPVMPSPVMTTPAGIPVYQPPQSPPANPATPVTPPVNPAIMNLANNDDLNVATIARQADKGNEERPADGEVVISLR